MSDIDLRVTPAEGVTDAYAAASGDHNPIHLDEAFARSVGLPGRILHGLWTAAQVARAAGAAAPAGPVVGAGEAARYGLVGLEVAFRGMGAIGPEVAVTGTIRPLGDDELAMCWRSLGAGLEARLDAVQDGTRLIRGARAGLRET